MAHLQRSPFKEVPPRKIQPLQMRSKTTKANIVVRIIRIVPVTVGLADIVLIIVPRATPQNTVIARNLPLRVRRWRTPIVGFAVLIRYPIPYIPGHIQSPIGADSIRITPHQRGDLVAIVYAPVNPIYIQVNICEVQQILHRRLVSTGVSVPIRATPSC